jgi:hypothetical protein
MMWAVFIWVKMGDKWVTVAMQVRVQDIPCLAEQPPASQAAPICMKV